MTDSKNASHKIKRATMATFGSPSTTQRASIDPNDLNIPQPGGDGISSLVWSPTANYLVSSNWDGGVRCWEVAEQAGRLQAQAKAMSKYDITVMKVSGGDSLFSSQSDKSARKPPSFRSNSRIPFVCETLRCMTESQSLAYANDNMIDANLSLFLRSIFNS